MLKFTKYLKRFWKEVLIGPVFKLTEAIFELIVPLVMAKIIDVGVANGDRDYVLKMGGVMVLLGLVGLGCALICQYCAARASQGFGTVVRSEMFRHINSLSHGEIDQIGTPSLITRITNDVNQLQLAVAMLIRLVVRSPFLVVGATVMALILDWRLACIFLIAGPLVALVLYLIMSRSIPYYRLIQRKLDRISLITRENLTGVRVIRAFSCQEQEKERFEEASTDQMNTSITVGKISALLNPLTSVIVNLAIVAVVWFGGLRVNVGGMTQGEVIAFVNYLNQILVAMIMVANLIIIFTKAAASAVTTAASGYASEVELLARLIHGEARGEPYVGMVAVGAVALNRVRSSRFPNTLAGVIYQSGAFDAVSDGQINLAPSEQSRRAARDALNGWDPTSGCLYYYNPATATSPWIWSREVRLTIGDHSFAV